MKKIFSTIALAFVSTLTFAQTADEVIAKYVTAIGGKDAIAKVNDYVQTLSGEVQGMTLDITMSRKGTDKMSQIVSIAGMGEVAKTLCDGKNFRSESQMAGTVNAEGNILKASIAQSGTFPEVNYIANGVIVTVAGTEKIGGKDAHKLELAIGDFKWTEFFDKESGLKVRQIIENPQGKATTDYSDYKEINGVKFAHKITQDLGMIQLELTASKTEVNKGLEDGAFTIK